MSGYAYGKTHGAMSLEARHRVARLERELREKDDRIRRLEARLGRRRQDDAALAKPYRETLDPEELNALPRLRYGDTEAICRMRLQAANAESDERASRNQSAAQQRRKAAA